MRDAIPVNVSRLLLVEGKVDQEFFIRLAAHMKLLEDWPLLIIQYGGKNRLAERLRTLTRPDTLEQIKRIGIVRDADFKTDAIQSVRDAIEKANIKNPIQLPIPHKLNEMTTGNTNVIVKVMPSVGREGMIEDLIFDVLRDDPVANCVEQYFDCLGKAEGTIVQERLPKARLRTFITGKNVGSHSAGRDFNRQYLSDVFHMSWWRDEFWDHPTFDDAKAFLVRLLAE